MVAPDHRLLDQNERNQQKNDTISMAITTEGQRRFLPHFFLPNNVSLNLASV